MSRRALVATVLVAVVLLIVLLVVALVVHGSSSAAAPGGAAAPVPSSSASSSQSVAAAPAPTPSPAGSGIAAAGPTAASRPAAAAALCAVTPAQLTRLTGISRDGDLESLRDAIGLLEDRLDQLSLAVQGRPALRPVIARLNLIHRQWVAAVADQDAGRKAAAKQAFAASKAQIGKLAGELSRAYPGSANEC